jgi:hypothetical protein
MRSIFILILGAGLPLWAGEAREIMDEVVRNGSAVSEQCSIRMALSSDGIVRERTALFFSRKKEDGRPELKKLIRFTSPPELAKSAVLTIENRDQDDGQWIYLPAVFTSKQIPSKNRSDRYMGTDFYYEDIVTMKLDEFEFETLGRESTGGTESVRISQVATSEKQKRESGYSKVVHWIDPAKKVILKSEYYGKDGKLAKRLQAGDIRAYGRYYRADKVQMEDLTRKHSTLIQYLDRKIDVDVPDRLFSIRSLERG